MKMYRYDQHIDENGSVTVRLLKFNVIRETACGVWVSLWPGKKRFINTNARKQFAYSTIEQAREAFIARKRRHIAILDYQLECALIALNHALDGQYDDQAN